MAAARSSTVSTLGPMALRVVRAGLAAVRTVAAAAASPSEALLRELQAAMQAAKQAKAARMQVGGRVMWGAPTASRLTEGWRVLRRLSAVHGRRQPGGMPRSPGQLVRWPGPPSHIRCMYSGYR